MKKYIFATLFLAAGLTTSCDKFLDEPPTSQITVATTADDYKNLLYALDMVMGMVPVELPMLGDDVYWTPFMYDYAAVNQFCRRAYMWEDEVFDATTVPESWQYLYKLIYNYNKVINEVTEVKGANPDLLNAIQAEARMYRANCYFMLAQMWAKPYQMASETDLGVPIPLENDVSKPAVAQSTVHDLYQFILDDLDGAIKYLAPYPEGASRFYACGTAAHGYKAKVLFFMGRYDDALTELNNTLALVKAGANDNPSLPYSFLDLNTVFWYIPGEMSSLPMYFMEPNPESIYTNSPMIDATNAYGSGGNNQFFVPQHLFQLLDEPGGLRTTWYFGYMSPDPENPTALSRMGGYSNVGLSMPELYLMLAECNVRVNNGSLTDALGYLNELRANRFDATYTPLDTDDKTVALRWILEERLREFMGYGIRWSDMRRLWDDPVGGPMINKTRTLGTETATLTKERLTLRIPEYVMRYNPEWTQHP